MTSSNGMPAGGALQDWRRVTAGDPCPVCAHDSWCTVAPDGGVVRCKRIKSDHPSAGDDGEAWLHFASNTNPRACSNGVLRKSRPKSTIDWRAVAERFAKAITDPQVQALADRLGVSPGALRDLGVGWTGSLYTFPMFAADGSVCGLRRRCPTTGEKKSWPGSKLGVFKPQKPDDGLLLVCEGESDTAAALTLGFHAIGVPGAGQCTAIAAAYASNRDTVVVGDNDPAGAMGIAKLKSALPQSAKSLNSVTPPAPHKDLRAWLIAGATRDDLQKLIDAAPTAPTEPEGIEVGDSNAEAGLIPLGKRDPTTGKLVLSAKRTQPTAKAFVAEFGMHPEGRILHSYAGQLVAWHDNHYSEVEEELAKHKLHPWLHDALTYKRNRDGFYELVPFEANPGTVKSALETIRAYAHMPASTIPPCWLGDARGRPSPLEILPFKNGNLHIPSRTVLQPTPRLFNTNALTFDYDPNAAAPTRWSAFLGDLFDDNIESVNLLQEWFGYTLVADTRQHKILLLVGPRRSGKGTIAKILMQLVGASNVVSPTICSLGGTFGLQQLLGKTLAVVSDARFTGENIGQVVERLLCISGDDAISVDRKFLESVTLRLPTRFMILTNELPRFNDASTALAGRFLVLGLSRSFYGKENHRLYEELLPELPGILLWALEGWRRLHERGRFIEPEASRDALQELEDLSSPVHAFVRERCVVHVGLRVPLQALYNAWLAWCQQEGIETRTSKATFGRDLAAAVPGVKRLRGTGQVPFYRGITLRRAEGQ